MCVFKNENKNSKDEFNYLLSMYRWLNNKGSENTFLYEQILVWHAGWQLFKTYLYFQCTFWCWKDICLDSALIWSRLPIARELRILGVKKWIYLNFCLSTWLQQCSRGDLHCWEFIYCNDNCWQKPEGKCLYFMYILELRGEKKGESWSLWWVFHEKLTWV